MGKNLENRNPTISLQNGGPGCMWGVLHILKYHHWRYIQKRLPCKRPVNGKNVTREDTKASRIGRICDDGRNGSDKIPTVDEKVAQPGPAAKTSMKSRLKSLISEELYSKKIRHRRASSCPGPSSLTRTDSIHRLDLSEEDHTAAGIMSYGTPTVTDEDDDRSTLRDPLVPDSSEEQNTEDCNTSVRTRTLSMDASSCQSKEISDALDIITMNKDFFLKVLQDPCSPLAQHFHSQHALRRKRTYSKSLSFSSSSSSPLRGSELRRLQTQKEMVYSDTVQPKSKEYNRSQSMPSVPVEYQTTRPRKNHAVMKRFRNLKDKIKHVIKQNKHEKHRIAMDGVLHRIPSGREPPKDLTSDRLNIDDNDSPRSSCESRHSVLSTHKTLSRCISRTPSLSESLDKYCQLYESSCKGEAKQDHYLEPLKLRTEDSSQASASKSMRRLFSFPDLKSCNCYDEDSSDIIPSGQVKEGADATVSTRSDMSERSDAESAVRSDIQQNLDGDRISVDGDRQKTETVSSIGEAKSDIISEDSGATRSKQDSELSEPKRILVPDAKFQEENAIPATLSSPEEADLKLTISLPLGKESDYMEGEMAETIIEEIPEEPEGGTERPEIQIKHMIQVEVGAKDKAEFDYVKDILELSGFSKNEVLGTWHSDEQPMDPCLFDQATSSCTLLDPDQDFSSGNQKNLSSSTYPCYHLLLFDLINEVLVEIYARSYTYCPMPLSILSHIRPMPVGHHVLEEVWTNISRYLGPIPDDADQLLDYIVGRDFAKCDGWMDLQFDCECVGLEVEDIIFDDLLDELAC